MPVRRIVLCFLLLLGWVALARAADPPKILPAERAVLLALYASTNGAEWKHHDGWGGASGTECSWYGVACRDSVIVRMISDLDGVVCRGGHVSRWVGWGPPRGT